MEQNNTPKQHDQEYLARGINLFRREEANRKREKKITKDKVTGMNHCYHKLREQLGLVC